MSRSRKWTFTLNNYTDEDEESLQEWDAVKYLVYGHEVADTGTPHLQGYAEFTSPMRFSTFKKRFPTIHLEATKGTAQQNFTYTTKEDGDDFVEIGERPFVKKKSRAKKDYAPIRIAAHTLTYREFLATDPSFSDTKLYEKHLEFVKFERDAPEVNWFWGPSGAGKTRTATELCADSDVYWVPPDARWFPGYDRHTHVIFDELRGQFRISSLLIMLDRAPVPVERKGGHTPWCPTHIYITTPYSPEQFMRKYYSGEQEEQLLRRITNVVYFPDPNDSEGS